MKKTATLLLGACIMMASYAHAGFNGNQNVQGNNGNASGAGNSDFGQCINGQGKKWRAMWWQYQLKRQAKRER